MAQNVQNILHDSLSTVGVLRRESSALSVASLPASILAPKPYKSKIPTPSKGSSSGRSTPLGGSRQDLRSPLPPPPPPLAPKPQLSRPLLRREISSPPSLENRRGSAAAEICRPQAATPATKGGVASRIPQWRGSSEKLSVIRKWDSSASLQLHNLAENEKQIKSKTKQNLELSAKNRELTQSLKQLHQTFLASNQIDPANVEALQCKLEQKDKEICALKQSAKERERKMEKMHLMLKKHRPPKKENQEEKNVAAPALSSSSFMELLAENAELKKKMALLAPPMNYAEDNNNPWKQELARAEAKIEDLTKALEDRISEVDLIEEKTKLVECNAILAEKLQNQQAELAKSVSQLQDARDQADLLEFRVLELEEEIEKSKPAKNDDEETELDASIYSDSGCNSSITTDVDILELHHQDFRNEKVADTKFRLHKLMMHTPQTQDKSLLVQTVALFEALLGKIKQLQEDNESLRKLIENNTEMDSVTKDRDQIVLELESTRNQLDEAKQTIVALTHSTASYEGQLMSLSLEIEKSELKNTKHSKVEEVLQKQVTELQVKLESAQKGRQAESEMAQEAMQKSSHLERSVSELNAKLKGLMEENSDLKEQLYSLLENHTTKSCGSETSKVPSDLSEHRDSTKGSSSSGVSSDLSDSSDHESDDHSKVYDFRAEASTQTASLEDQRSELTHLTMEVEKLSKFKALIASQDSHHIDNKGRNGEELADLRLECKQLVTRKNSLETELENYKGEISILRQKLVEGGAESSQKMTSLEMVEFSLRSQLKEWEKKYEALKKNHQVLLEEKCELEEAENDSRLNAQRWEQQHRATVEKTEVLNEQLNFERKSSNILKSELDNTRAHLDDARNEVGYLEALVQRYEQRVFDLEELEVELREKLSLLEGAVHFSVWWNSILMNQGTRIPARPMLVNYSSNMNNQAAFVIENNEDEWQAMIEQLRAEKMQLTQTLNAMMAEKESLAISLEGNQEDKIQRILTLEDKLSELQTEAVEHKKQCTLEIAQLKEKLSSHELDEDKTPKVSLDDREEAYRQTIAEADSLLSKLESDYKATISHLQAEKSQLEDQVRILEQSQGHLKNQLARLVNDTERKDEMADLAERLLASERRELDLKEKLHAITKAEKELELTLSEQRKVNEDLKRDLKDQDEILQSSMKYQQENQKLSSDLSRLRETESFLSGRVEELEQEASSLKNSLVNVDKKIWDRDRKWQEKVDSLEDELATSITHSEDTRTQHSLKIEVEGLKAQSVELQRALQEKAQEAEKSEAAFRSEVAKLRNQLTLSNNQLTECDQMNCKLREDFEHAKALLESHVAELELAKAQEEQNLIQWNQMLADRDSQILELQDKLDSLLQPRMNSARSREELEAISDSEGGLIAVTKQLKQLSAALMGCTNCQNEPCKELIDAIQDLETFSTVICGGSQNPSFRKFNSLKRLDLLRCESEELLSKSTIALNLLASSGNSIEEVDEDQLSSVSSYHSSASNNQELEDHQMVLARSLEELQYKLNRMEQELIIVGEESKELQERLCHREEDLNQKNKELRELAGVVEHMRLLNVRTAEQLEKQKLKANSFFTRLDQTQGLVSQLHDKCANKDLLLRTLVDLIQNMNGICVATLVRSLREITVKPSFVKKGGIDFNLESLCQYLEASANALVRKKSSEDLDQESVYCLPEQKPKKINPTLMPPQNFRITRRVGSDSLLVAWMPPNDPEVSGYLVYVNGQLHQKVRSASRTKALLHGLNLRVDFELSIHSIGCHGATVSTSEVSKYKREMVLKPPPVPAKLNN